MDLFTFFLLISLPFCFSQLAFIDITNTITFPDGLPPGVYDSSVAWEDFNNDGLSDFLLTGNSSVPITKLYMQNSSGIFLDITNTITFPDGLPPGVYESSVAWEDFNDDGLSDFLLTGSDNSGVRYTKLYMQNSSGIFIDITNTITFPDGTPPDVWDSSVAWEDFNDDGLSDFLLTGEVSSGVYITKLYMQNSSGIFLDITNTITFPDGLPPNVTLSSVDWEDFNNDGLSDFLLTGEDNSFQPTTKLYMQNSSGIFLDITNNITFPDGTPPGVLASSVAWEDFNDDGLSDFLLTGYNSSAFVTKLYMQNSSGIFLDITNTITFPDGTPPDVYLSSVAWEDFNNDGLSDFLLTGFNSSTFVTKLYMQNSTGIFIDITNTITFPNGTPPGVFRSSVAWEDFNDDGLSDFLLTGRGNAGVRYTKLYMNGCSSGYFLNGTQCSICEGFTSSDQRDCIVCTLDTYFDNITDSCELCNSGEIPTDNQLDCEQCPLNQIPNNEGTMCEDCQIGQIPNENQTTCIDEEEQSSSDIDEVSTDEDNTGEDNIGAHIKPFFIL